MDIITARANGMRAYDNGLTESANPYSSKQATLQSAWQKGFQTAKRYAALASIWNLDPLPNKT